MYIHTHRKISHKKGNPDGLLAVVHNHRHNVDADIDTQLNVSSSHRSSPKLIDNPLYLIVEGIEKPGNLGIAHIYSYIHIHTHTYMYKNTDTYVFMHTYIHMHIYSYIHLHTLTCTYT